MSNSTRISRRRGKERKKNTLREILEWIGCFAAALLLALLIRTFIGEPVQVRGPSMTPTLLTGQRVIASKITYLLRDPEHGEIAVVRYPNRKELFIKRVIGIPGDRISVSAGTLYINGEPQEEPYIREPIGYTMEEVEVPEGHYFVLGDNRNDSTDSHVTTVGMLTRSQIRGKAVFRIWPFNAWGSLKEH